MRYLRNKRGLAGVGALATVIGVTMWVVLPALAAPPGSGNTASAPYTQVPPPASPSGIIPIDEPTGGQSNDCAFFYTAPDNQTTKSQPTFQFRISNPKKGDFTYTDPQTNAQFEVVVDKSDKWAWFKATNAGVVDVGIKGGTDETWYNYDQASPLFPSPPVNDAGGFVTHDGDTSSFTSGGLHAPLQDTTNNVLYSVSNLTFCYNLGSVSGTVYEDANYSGSLDSGESGLAGWTIRLYQGSGTTPVATTTSDASGAYHINTIFDPSSSYTVCEVPNPNSPLPAGTDTWIESQPSGADATTCSGAGELAHGWALSGLTTPIENVSGKDFGNVGGFKCTSGSPVGPSTFYEIGTCKPADTYVFDTGAFPSGSTVGGQSVDGAPYVLYGIAGTDTSPTATIEHLTVSDPFDSNNQPLYTSVWYTDEPMFPLPADLSGLDWKPMPYCTVDPRGASPTHWYDIVSGTSPGDVIPGYNSSTGTPTSCIISVKTSAPTTTGQPGTLEAYVYALDDVGRMGF
jgi:SdrD B-like domain